MQKVKPYLVGILVGIVLTASGFGYWYFTRPEQPKQQVSDMQQWVVEHPKEAEWAKARYEKFQKAAVDAYLENDVADIKPSK